MRGSRRFAASKQDLDIPRYRTSHIRRQAQCRKVDRQTFTVGFNIYWWWLTFNRGIFIDSSPFSSSNFIEGDEESLESN